MVRSINIWISSVNQGRGGPRLAVSLSEADMWQEMYDGLDQWDEEYLGEKPEDHQEAVEEYYSDMGWHLTWEMQTLTGEF